MGLFKELKRRNVVRMALFYLLGAWVVLQVADVLVGVAGLPDWTLRLVGLVLLLGLPLALVFSWVYQLTPEGLKKEASVDASGRKVTVTRAQRLILVASFAVVMVGGYVLIERFIVEQQRIDEQAANNNRTPRTRAVVVAAMPIENHGQVPVWELGPQRLHHASIRMLNHFGDLQVVSAERTAPFENTDLTIQELAEELLASHIMTGEAWHEESGSRLGLKLFDGETGKRLWAKEFERPIIVNDQYQDAVWGRALFEIGRALRDLGLTDMAEDTDDPMAFEAFYKAAARENFGPDPEERAEAERWFREAIMLDPDFADAYAHFAFFWYGQTNWGRPWHEVRGRALENAQKALEINPDSPQANASMARILLHEGNPSEAEIYAEKAVQVAPLNPSVREDYRRTLRAQGKIKEEVDQLKIMLGYFPDHKGYMSHLVYTLAWLRRFDEAEMYLERLVELGQDLSSLVGGRFWLAYMKGDWLEALQIAWEQQASGNMWVYQEYLPILFRLGALDAVELWAREFASRHEGRGMTRVHGHLRAALMRLDKLDAAQELNNSLEVVDEKDRTFFNLSVDFRRSLNGSATEPDTRRLLDSLDDRCAQMLAKYQTETGYQLLPEIGTYPSVLCLVHSYRRENPIPELGSAVLRYLDENPPMHNHLQPDRGLVHKAIVLALRGDVEQAIEALTVLQKQGFRKAYVFDFWEISGTLKPLYHGLGDMPEFQAMVTEINRENGAVLEKIRANAPWLLDPRISGPETEGEAEAIASG